MPLQPISGFRIAPLQVVAPTAMPVPGDPPVKALQTGDAVTIQHPGGGPFDALRAKLGGNAPSLSLQFDAGATKAVDPTALRQAAIQGRKPMGVTHDEAFKVKRAALVQLQQAQAGSAVAALATASLAVIDGATSASLFRRTEFCDKIFDSIAVAADDQFLAPAVGSSAATSSRTLANGIVETRGANAGEEGDLNRVALVQVQRLATPGSYVAGLLDANQQVSRALTSEADKSQLADQALKEVTSAPDTDFILGSTPRIGRSLAKEAQWTLSGSDADRILLKSNALRQIARIAQPTSRVAAVANEALRITAAATSVAEQDNALKNALDAITMAGDSEF